MTKEIQLTKGVVVLVDDDDYEWLSKFRWAITSTNIAPGYAGTYIRSSRGTQKRQLMHRMIIERSGEAIHELEVDHRDGNTLNNCRDNLRVCTASENQRNRRRRTEKPYSSQYRGIYSRKSDGRFHVRVTIKHKFISLGYYKDEHVAAQIYNLGAAFHYGEFASPNVIPVEQQMSSFELLKYVNPRSKAAMEVVAHSIELQRHIIRPELSSEAA